MCTNLLKDSRTFEFLQEIDQDSENKAASDPCRFCGDRLHRAFYERKPRAPGLDLSVKFKIRPSFCCRRDGCRRRMTPALVRFLGRKVYVSIIVVLVAAMTQGASPKRLCKLQAELGISPQTVRRWSQFWRGAFTTQSAWRYQKGNFMPPVDEMGLPFTLLARLEQSLSDNFLAAIALIRIALDCSFNPHPQQTR